MKKKKLSRNTTNPFRERRRKRQAQPSKRNSTSPRTEIPSNRNIKSSDTLQRHYPCPQEELYSVGPCEICFPPEFMKMINDDSDEFDNEY